MIVDAGQFHREYVTVISPGHTTDITGAGHKQCFKANQVKIAAFWGQWDEMHLILDTLGLDYTWFNFEWDFYNDTNPNDIEALQVLRDPTRLDDFDIVFSPLERFEGDWTADGISRALDAALEDAEVDLVIATGPTAANLLTQRDSSSTPALAAFMLSTSGSFSPSDERRWLRICTSL